MLTQLVLAAVKFAADWLYGTKRVGRKRGVGGNALTAGVLSLHLVLTLLHSAILPVLLLVLLLQHYPFLSVG